MILYGMYDIMRYEMIVYNVNVEYIPYLRSVMHWILDFHKKEVEQEQDNVVKQKVMSAFHHAPKGMIVFEPFM